MAIAMNELTIIWMGKENWKWLRIQFQLCVQPAKFRNYCKYFWWSRDRAQWKHLTSWSQEMKTCAYSITLPSDTRTFAFDFNFFKHLYLILILFALSQFIDWERTRTHMICSTNTLSNLLVFIQSDKFKQKENQA